jgi:hypothetical protein
MTLTLNISDSVLAGLGIAEADLPQAMLEAFAVEGYREGRLSCKQVRLLLGHGSRWETEDFLSAHNVWPGLTVEEVREDSRRLSNLLRQ